MATSTARSAAWRERRRALGLCIHCGVGPRRPDRDSCAPCLDRKAAAQRPRNAARDAAAREERARPAVANENAIACRERYAALRAVGLCGKCKADSAKHAECLACRRKRVRA